MPVVLLKMDNSCDGNIGVSVQNFLEISVSWMEEVEATLGNLGLGPYQGLSCVRVAYFHV